MKTTHFKHICIIARQVLTENPEMDWTSASELVKVATSRAGFDYDGNTIGEAMERVKASTKYRGPHHVAPAKVTRRLPESFAPAPMPAPMKFSPEKPIEKSDGPAFVGLGAIISELGRRGLMGSK